MPRQFKARPATSTNGIQCNPGQRTVLPWLFFTALNNPVFKLVHRLLLNMFITRSKKFRRPPLDIGAIENAYRRYARFYDVVFGAVFQPGRKAIIEHMNCRPGERVLEVGVGTGLSLPLYPKNVLVSGIDISRDMLELAHARKVRDQMDNIVQLSVMDAENMEFDDSSFDKVVAMYVASVVPDPERLVDEMRRVCKPNGQLIFVNHFHSRNPVFGAFERLLAPLSKQLGFRPDFSLDRFINKTGLTATDIHPVNIFNFCTMVDAINNKQFDSMVMEPVYVVS
jgi:phosphatidylethanolamine/phosphatidyl-N-methylethanolamine N-methyltransferase